MLLGIEKIWMRTSGLLKNHERLGYLMTQEFKKGLIKRLKQTGAFDVRIADPKQGFEHSLPGYHPLEIWEKTKSVVVFAVAMSPLTNNTYMGPYAPWVGDRNVGPVPEDIKSETIAYDRVSRLFTSSVILAGIKYLEEKGYNSSTKNFPLKLAAYEAGLGVYGKSGIILNPVLGNRMNLGGILTAAELEPDGRLTDFDPCKDCDICLKACPAKAFNPEKQYPHSWSREACQKKRAEIAAKGLYDHNCFASCPAGGFLMIPCCP